MDGCKGLKKMLTSLLEEEEEYLELLLLLQWLQL
jgi:hypothetical protein